MQRVEEDPLQCKDWLQALGQLVTTHELTERAVINFMQLNARRAAADTIAEAIAEGCGYEEIVVQLETHFAGLRPPEQARHLCHQQRMKKDETIEEFGCSVGRAAVNVRAALVQSVRETVAGRPPTSLEVGRARTLQILVGSTVWPR